MTNEPKLLTVTITTKDGSEYILSAKLIFNTKGKIMLSKEGIAKTASFLTKLILDLAYKK